MCAHMFLMPSKFYIKKKKRKRRSCYITLFYAKGICASEADTQKAAQRYWEAANSFLFWSNMPQLYGKMLSHCKRKIIFSCLTISKHYNSSLSHEVTWYFHVSQLNLNVHHQIYKCII